MFSTCMDLSLTLGTWSSHSDDFPTSESDWEVPIRHSMCKYCSEGVKCIEHRLLGTGNFGMEISLHFLSPPLSIILD